MGAGFGKKQGVNPDGFDALQHGAYQMVPLDGNRTIIVSSDHREWSFKPSAKWKGDVTATTDDGRVVRMAKNSFTLPPQVSAAFKFEGNAKGPAYFSLETAGAPQEAQALMLSVLPVRKRDIAVSIIKSDMLHTNPLSRADIVKAIIIAGRLYSDQANVDLIDSQGYVDDWEFPLVDLGNPIIISPWFLLKTKARVGIFKRRIQMVFGWNFEAPDHADDEELVGQTFMNVDLCFIETERGTFREVVSTTVHELGHAFDLGHEPNDITNMMYPNSAIQRIRFNSHQIETLNGYNSSFPS